MDDSLEAIGRVLRHCGSERWITPFRREDQLWVRVNTGFSSQYPEYQEVRDYAEEISKGNFGGREDLIRHGPTLSLLRLLPESYDDGELNHLSIRITHLDHASVTEAVQALEAAHLAIFMRYNAPLQRPA